MEEVMTFNDLRSGIWSVTIASSITIVLASLFVFVRLFNRIGFLKIYAADDIFIVIAWAIALGMNISIILVDFKVRKGHEIDLPTRIIVRKNPALMATKTSILIFYLRIANDTQKFLRMASYVTLFIVNIGGVVLTFLNAFQRDFGNSAFSQTHGLEKSYFIVILYLCSAPLNIFTDLAILVLPIPTLTAMRLPLRQKKILVVTFIAGAFVTIVNVVRIYYLQKAIHGKCLHKTELGAEEDFLMNTYMVFVWCAVEVNVGIICCCIPTLNSLVDKILPVVISRTVSAILSIISFKRHSLAVNSFDTHQRITIDLPTIQHPHPALITGDSRKKQHILEINLPSIQTRTRLDASERPLRQLPWSTETTSNFRFFNGTHPKSMLTVHGWESFRYCSLVTMLFYLWGFSYGLLLNLSNVTSFTYKDFPHNQSLITVYFTAYFFGALTVGKTVLCNLGFRATFTTGLAIYATGALVCWPSAVINSYWGLIATNFIIGFGLAVLETAANSFLILCGPVSKSEFRLLLAQGVQAIATIFSQIFVEKSLNRDNPSLNDLQWIFIAITLFTVTLAMVIYYNPIPEVSDDELDVQASQSSTSMPLSDQNHSHDILTATTRKIYGRILSPTLLPCIIAQFLYVSGQESLPVFTQSIFARFSSNSTSPTTTSAINYVIIAHALFALGRFSFALLCLIIAPRFLLLMALIAYILCAALTAFLPTPAVTVDHSAKNKLVSILRGLILVIYFFEGPIFPMMYTFGLRRLGRHTKAGAAYLICASCAGGIFPWILLAARNLDSRWNRQVLFGILVALFAGIVVLLAPVSGFWGMRKEAVSRDTVT